MPISGHQNFQERMKNENIDIESAGKNTIVNSDLNGWILGSCFEETEFENQDESDQYSISD